MLCDDRFSTLLSHSGGVGLENAALAAARPAVAAAAAAALG